ncbi:hypothetical protein Tco_1133868 [Tanacetum coccineum]
MILVEVDLLSKMSFRIVEKVKALGANSDMSGSRLGVVWMEVGGGIMRARVVSRVVLGLVVMGLRASSVIAPVMNDPIYLWQPPLLLVDGDAHLGKRGIDLRVGQCRGAFTTHEMGDQNLCVVEESKAEDEENVEDITYPGKEDGLDLLSFMAWVKAALMTFSEDMLIRRSQSQSLCSPRRVVLSLASGITLNGIDRSSLPSSTSSGVKPAKKIKTALRSTAALPRHLKGSWDEEKKEKVQGEISSKELVKTCFFSTGHGVKLEGSMNYAKGKSWALLLSIYKWSRQRAPLEQKTASCKHYSKSSELRNKSEASRARTTAIVESVVTHKYLAFQKKRLLISTNANGDHRSRRTSETAIELIKK